jgi:hypothetical protein
MWRNLPVNRIEVVIMRISRVAQFAPSSPFISAKTAVVIQAPHPLVRDALVQATLDPQVRSIGVAAQPQVDDAQAGLNAIVVVRDDGSFVLDVAPARPVRDARHEELLLNEYSQLGLNVITLTAADIRREPRFANSRLVWSYRLAPVGIGLRMAVMQVLADDGPMSLSRLLSAVRSDRDPSPPIMALTCSDLIELDLVSRPLGPATIVRLRV